MNSISRKIKYNVEKKISKIEEKEPSFFELMIIVIEEIEAFKYLDGYEKENYVVEILTHLIPDKVVGRENEIRQMIKQIIKLTKGAYAINLKHNLLGKICSCIKT